jgi:hypothetical protein
MTPCPFEGSPFQDVPLPGERVVGGASSANRFYGRSFLNGA